MAGSEGMKSGKSPNLVFVFPDQMRGQALGFMGEDPVVTSNLDRFARQSLVLTQAVANYPVCSPYRAMLMTGMYPHRNRVLGNCNSQTTPYGCELQESDRCWSDILNDAGYSLGYIGKWHLDSPREPYVDCENNHGKTKWNEWCPPHRRHGFDYWYSYGTYDYHLKPMYWSGQADRDGFHFVDQWGPEHEADMAIRYLENRDGEYRDSRKPFGLVVSMNPPHTPYHLHPEKYDRSYHGKTSRDLIVRPNVDTSGETKMSKHALEHTKDYFASVTGVDDQFGRILKALEVLDLEENTIVVFTSDHGDCVGTHDQITKNNPYEESMRVPFMIRWPDRIAARQDDLLLSTTDIYPTLLELMGLDERTPARIQGTSRARLFTTGTGDRPGSQLYLRSSPTDPLLGLRGVRTHTHKLVYGVHRNERTVHLYDLEADPFEMENLAETQPEIVRQLSAEELYPWLEKIDDPWIANLDTPERTLAGIS
jgi:arylsulfatase A-like enzyme